MKRKTYDNTHVWEKKGHITSYTQEIWKEYYDKLRTQWT